jgi:hypothetical protein
VVDPQTFAYPRRKPRLQPLPLLERRQPARLRALQPRSAFTAAAALCFLDECTPLTFRALASLSSPLTTTHTSSIPHDPIALDGSPPLPASPPRTTTRRPFRQWRPTALTATRSPPPPVSDCETDRDKKPSLVAGSVPAFRWTGDHEQSCRRGPIVSISSSFCCRVRACPHRPFLPTDHNQPRTRRR